MDKQTSEKLDEILDEMLHDLYMRLPNDEGLAEFVPMTDAYHVLRDEAKSAIAALYRQKEMEARIDEATKMMESLQESANHTPPNLLLNEVVNYRYKPVRELGMEDDGQANE